jgi:MFS family permease
VTAEAGSPIAPPVSYRALLAVPHFPPVVLSTLLSRVGGQMSSIALILFVLTRYHSPGLAGLATFLSIFPGLLVSPLAGALLDRHGRKRLIILDYLFAMLAWVLIGVLSLAHHLPIPLLLVITGLQAVTAPLSQTGLRTLFPLLVPRTLWERANAVDSNLYVLAGIIGPALAGILVAIGGGELALIATGLFAGAAAVAMLGLRDPETNMVTTGSLLRDAWQGLVYVVRNPTLRGLALSLFVANLGGGILAIAFPVLVFQRLHQGPAAIGLLLSVMGFASLIAVIVWGRLRTEGIERQLLSWPQFGFAGGLLLIVLAPNLWVVALAMVVFGVVVGPLDIALFTVRQRRTDPAWMGRAFAVSMMLNYSGVPVGSALAGPLIAWSLSGSFYVTIGLVVIAGILPLFLIPQHDS